jgi:dissimilatory sulfite reductase (desulfoviridin) alpha/beta subunit
MFDLAPEGGKILDRLGAVRIAGGKLDLVDTWAHIEAEWSSCVVVGAVASIEKAIVRAANLQTRVRLGRRTGPATSVAGAQLSRMVDADAIAALVNDR